MSVKSHVLRTANSITTVSEVANSSSHIIGYNSSNTNANTSRTSSTTSSRRVVEKRDTKIRFDLDAEARAAAPDVNQKLLATNVNNKQHQIRSRIVFLRIGQVDTKNERYDAEAYIECSWEDDKIFKILADPNLATNRLEKMVDQVEAMQLNPNPMVNLKHVINNISLLEYDPSMFWSPQLFIDNAIGDIKEDIKYKLEIVEKDGRDLLNDPDLDTRDEQCKHLIVNNLTVRVYEIRKVKGVFYERLELQDFPMDMQELSITLTSQRSDREVEFVRNLKDPCSINTSDFLDQQQWDLDSNVRVNEKKIHDIWRKYDRNGFVVSCLIVRKPGYYLLNAYMLIFLITALGFVAFSFNVTWPHFRCTVTGLFLLTSVNFRYVITQRLPSVAYLTSLDKYAIGSLLILVTFCCWHAIISSNVFAINDDNRIPIDDYFLIGSAVFYALFNLFFFLWFIKMYKSNKSSQIEFEKQNRPT